MADNPEDECLWEIASISSMEPGNGDDLEYDPLEFVSDDVPAVVDGDSLPLFEESQEFLATQPDSLSLPVAAVPDSLRWSVHLRDQLRPYLESRGKQLRKVTLRQYCAGTGATALGMKVSFLYVTRLVYNFPPTA